MGHKPKPKRAERDYLPQPAKLVFAVAPVSAVRASGRLEQPHVLVVTERPHSDPERSGDIPDSPLPLAGRVHATDAKPCPDVRFKGRDRCAPLAARA